MGLAQALEGARQGKELYVEGLTFEDEQIPVGFDATFFEFHGVEFRRCVLSGARLAKASFYDCTFRECDLTGADLTSAFLARTRLYDSKLEGAAMTGAILRSSRLVGCQCRYLNAGEATLENALIEGCDLSEAFLSEVRLKRSSRLVDTRLVRADLFRTTLSGINL